MTPSLFAGCQLSRRAGAARLHVSESGCQDDESTFRVVRGAPEAIRRGFPSRRASYSLKPRSAPGSARQTMRVSTASRAYSQLVTNLLCSECMKTQHVFAAVVVALSLTPVVLSVGTFVLVPLVLLLLAFLPVVALLGLSLLVVSGARAAGPLRVHAGSLPTTVVCSSR